MKLSHSCFLAAAGIVSAMSLSSCDDGKSYADLLTEETHAVNYYLSNHKVVDEIPADSVFQYTLMRLTTALMKTATFICRLSIPVQPTTVWRMMS